MLRLTVLKLYLHFSVYVLEHKQHFTFSGVFVVIDNHFSWIKSLISSIPLVTYSCLPACSYSHNNSDVNIHMICCLMEDIVVIFVIVIITDWPTGWLADWLTNELTNSMERVPSWKVIVSQLVKTFLALYRTQRFIHVFTTACQLFLSWTGLIQFMLSNPISLRLILILFSYLYQGLPSGPFPSDSRTKSLYAFLFFPMHAAVPAIPNDLFKYEACVTFHNVLYIIHTVHFNN